MSAKQKETPQKPKYNMWQCAWFMIRLAVREQEKKILVMNISTVLIQISSDLLNLAITPALLGAVEFKSPLGNLFFLICGFVLLSMLLSSASTYISYNIVYAKVTVRSVLLTMLNNKSATTSYPNIDNEQFIKMRSKAMDSVNCNDAAGEAIWNTMTTLLKNVLGFLIYLTMLSSVNPLLILVITATTLLGYFINKPLSEYGYRHRDEEGRYTNTMWYYLTCAESSKLAKDIRLFGMRPWLEDLYTKTLAAYRALQTRAQNTYIWGRIADLVLAFLRNGFVYAYLIRLMLQGDLSVSLFLLYFAAAGNFSGWVSGILDSLLTMYKQSLELSNIWEFLEFPESFRFEEGEPLVPDPEKKYELRMENVSFRYPAAGKDTLSHISLVLHPGEKLAVVGLNGAGKTTLIKLLCGFLDPTEGKVLLDGRDIRDYNRRDYYKMFSAVFQNFSLLATTIAANVAQTETGIQMSRVKNCIAKAGLTEKIESLPGQYEEKLNRDIHEDAVMLSGGETQRLMLARALYKNAPFVMLDEPTAALDPIAEADMYNKYHEMTMGRSSVYISHRLASTRFCDRIILIEDGQVTEEGTHEELMAQKGHYAELFEVQSKYYRKEVDTNHEA